MSESPITKAARILRDVADSLEREEARREPELKPCPFCGSSDVAILKGCELYTAKCNTCLARSQSVFSKSHAISLWNKRS